MCILVKDSFSPPREMALDQLRFEIRNKMISSSAMCRTTEMPQWMQVDEFIRMLKTSGESLKEKRLDESWLYRQLQDKQSHVLPKDPPLLTNQSQIPGLVRILAKIGIFLTLIFFCVLSIGYVLNHGSGSNPVIAGLLGAVLFRRVYRIQCVRQIVQNPASTFFEYYTQASVISLLKCLACMLPACAFGIAGAETSQAIGSSIGTVIGLFLIIAVLGFDVPFWVWRKKNLYAGSGYPERNTFWAAGAGFVFFWMLFFVIQPGIPAIERAISRANQVVEISKNTPRTAPVFTPLENQYSHPPAALSKDVSTVSSVSGKRVQARSGMFSVLLPEGWVEDTENGEFDLSAESRNATLEIHYFADNKKTSIDISRTMRDKAQREKSISDVSELSEETINGSDWVKFSYSIPLKNKSVCYTTSLALSRSSGLFLLRMSSIRISYGEHEKLLIEILNHINFIN